ncbi:MAG: glycosyltransferase family 2 protein [Limisphaerales bacterium]
MTPLPISVCMISGAEAGRIGPALASVAGWVADVQVVLNEEVADGTEEICRAHGAAVQRRPWAGYVAQMQAAAELATRPWVLALDADERVSAELRGEIEAAFLRGPDAAVAAFSMPRMTWYLDRWIRHGDWYPDRKVRLWRRGQGRWAGQDPHYHLEVRGQVVRLHAALLHLSFPSLGHHVRKIDRYGDLYARAAGGASLGALAVRPAWRFVRGYVIRGGFLDGRAGFMVAMMTAFEAFVRHAKRIERSSGQSPEPSAAGPAAGAA